MKFKAVYGEAAFDDGITKTTAKAAKSEFCIFGFVFVYKVMKIEFRSLHIKVFTMDENFL